MNLKIKYKELLKNNSAIIAANFYNLETLKGLLLAAAETDSQIILQLSQGSIDYIGLRTAVGLAKSALEDYGVVGWLHLDHGNSIELVEKCLDAGFDSVMIDGSELAFEKNIELTVGVVELAKKYNVPVEAELGYIPKLGQKQSMEDGYTKSREAKLFIEATGVDALAIAVGTAHGFYKEKPKLNFERLVEIRKAIPETILVLHGSSGIPDNDIKKAVSFGINKINVATEFKNVFMRSIRKSVSLNDEIDLRKIFPGAIEQVKELAKSKISLVKETQLI